MNMKPDSLVRWTRDNAADLYGIRNWGHGYFDISERGEVEVRPLGNGSRLAISIMDVRQASSGGASPVLPLRGHSSSRTEQLYGAFNAVKRALDQECTGVCIRSRSTSRSRWWTRSWNSAGSIITGWRPAARRN